MTEQNTEAASRKRTRAKNKRAPTKPLADNVFKEATEEEGRALGLENVAGELQLRKSTLSDLVLKVPEGVSVKNTIFDFFSPLNIIEFKSEDDNPLDDREFYKNVMRLYAIYIQDKKMQMQDLLNVIVTAEEPKKFLSFMAETGYNFEKVPEREWLRRGKFGNQEIAIVICELLPFEPKYYRWILFAPTKSENWRKLVRELLTTGTYPDLIEEAIALHLEQVQVIYKEVAEMARSGKSQIPAWQRERIEAFKRVFQEEHADGDKLLLDAVLSTYPVEERIAGLKPEERVAGLKPEERLAGLKPEEREILLKLLQQQQSEKDKPDNSKN